MYLPDEQITYTPATSSNPAVTTTGTRYYSLGGTAVADRTVTKTTVNGTTTTSGGLDYLIGNQQGTSAVAVDAGTLAVTRRYYDPYGNPVGTGPAWPGPRGFVGSPTDTTTGYDILG